MDTTIVSDILERNGNEKDGLIATLGDIQAEFGYLPEDALRMVSEKTGKALIDLYGIASFYTAFSLKPQGKHLIQVCLGTACHVRGGHRVLDEVRRRLNVEVGDTTDDQQFTLKTVNCLGACALGPIVVVDNEYHGNTRIQKVNSILNKYREISEEV
ncbi:NAD(P)H-dependent oxidoreductase subunit E [candidate division KSB1 bacterium]|nr:NAD(P)H-dependent oxidoreductase subunit E [candidate division KSB1 bacterium]